MERYDGYDEDSQPTRPPRMSDAEVDAEIDRRQQLEIEEADIEKLNAAILKLNANLRWPI